MSDDIEAEAMKAVIDSMGRAANAAKVKKYTRKTMPVVKPQEVEPVADEAMPTQDELAAMIGE